ncbi:MAG: hypothetical protein OXG97_19540 [Candidatus Poribacteria bacterium]|nr:hypothetical protein [Candidatus Poribacteria bacterium]
MAETVETLAERLDRLEKVLEQVTLQLSCLVDELVPNAPEHCKSEAPIPTSTTTENKEEGARIMNELLERMGIADVEPIPIAELHKSMASHIRAEDNEFSRAIIEEREK